MVDVTGRVPDEVPTHWLVLLHRPRRRRGGRSRRRRTAARLPIGPFDLDIGRFAILQDQFGAAFAVMAPTDETARNAP